MVLEFSEKDAIEGLSKANYGNLILTIRIK